MAKAVALAEFLGGDCPEKAKLSHLLEVALHRRDDEVFLAIRRRWPTLTLFRDPLVRSDNEPGPFPLIAEACLRADAKVQDFLAARIDSAPGMDRDTIFCCLSHVQSESMLGLLLSAAEGLPGDARISTLSSGAMNQCVRYRFDQAATIVRAAGSIRSQEVLYCVASVLEALSVKPAKSKRTNCIFNDSGADLDHCSHLAWSGLRLFRALRDIGYSSSRLRAERPDNGDPDAFRITSLDPNGEFARRYPRLISALA